MVLVQVIGDHEVATAPVRRALGRVRGVVVLDRQASPGSAAVDTVVIDQSLGAGRAPDGLPALAAVYPGASFLVVAFLEGNKYHWLHVQPDGAAFRVYEAGTGTLSRIMAATFARAPGERQAPDHATVPAMPCSTA